MPTGFIKMETARNVAVEKKEFLTNSLPVDARSLASTFSPAPDAFRPPSSTLLRQIVLQTHLSWHSLNRFASWARTIEERLAECCRWWLLGIWCMYVGWGYKYATNQLRMNQHTKKKYSTNHIAFGQYKRHRRPTKEANQPGISLVGRPTIGKAAQ